MSQGSWLDKADTQYRIVLRILRFTMRHMNREGSPMRDIQLLSAVTMSSKEFVPFPPQVLVDATLEFQ